MLRPLFVVVLAALAVSASPRRLFAQTHDSSVAVVRALMARLDSAANRDPALVQDLFADDFYAVHGPGTVQRKAEWLALRSRLRVHSVDWNELQFFDYGDAIVVFGTVRRVYDLPDGRPADERRRMTYVWVRRNGSWQLAVMHGTRIN
jgi:ketosteroid isomerase-like protein